ncbi:MAG: hypothetical protein ACRD41_02305, partial [Candidatus Acidiferrales bacterium]
MQQRRSGIKNPGGPVAAVMRIEPKYPVFKRMEGRGGQKFKKQSVNAPLEGAIFGAEAVGFDFDFG